MGMSSVFFSNRYRFYAARQWVFAGSLLIAGLVSSQGAYAQSFSMSAVDVMGTTADSVSTLVHRANQAFAANRIVSPIGENALELFVAASSADENNPGVREGLVDIYPLAVAAIEHAIAERRFDDAVRALNLLDKAVPDSLTAKNLRVKVGAQVGNPIRVETRDDSALEMRVAAQ
jgi:hypothetical protein